MYLMFTLRITGADNNACPINNIDIMRDELLIWDQTNPSKEDTSAQADPQIHTKFPLSAAVRW